MSDLNAKVSFVDGLQFVGEAGSGHSIVMDGTAEFGGRDTGPRPMELLLMGLGGCTGMDVVSILKKKRQPFTGLDVAVSGTKAGDHPQRFTDIEIEFVVRGSGVKEEAVGRAVELSMDKYCSVKATLEGSAKIGFSYRVVDE
jgi:putative redox protein